MVDFEVLKKMFNEGDRFCRASRIRMTEISEGRATAVLSVTPEALNANDVVQGGAVFTLADFAFAGAANSYGIPCTTQGADIAYLRPGTGAKLTAHAEVVNRGRRSCLVDVRVVDENGKLVAKAQCTGFFLEKQAN